MKRSSAKKVVRPISRKAYNGFVDRIISLLGHTAQASSLVTALDLYLEGNGCYGDGLDACSRLAFEFLRQDVDVAMERSRKARARAAMRKTMKNNAPAQSEASSVAAVSAPAASVPQPQSQTPDFFTQLSRRDRRALQRQGYSLIPTPSQSGWLGIKTRVR